MLIWAVGCAGLSLLYGFRERWAESIDDEYLYYFCKYSEDKNMKLDGLEILKKV